MRRKFRDADAPGTYHRLAQEVLLQRTFALSVVLQRDVAVRAEGTRKHGDISKDRLERLVQDVRHLVLEVLCGDEWIEQLLALVDHGMDLSTASAEVRVVVERLPQMVDSFVSRFGTSIN